MRGKGLRTGLLLCMVMLLLSACGAHTGGGGGKNEKNTKNTDRGDICQKN